MTPAEVDAGCVAAVRGNLRLVNQDIEHITNPDHICHCSDPPDWLDLDDHLAENLYGLTRCTENLLSRRRAQVRAHDPD